MYISNYYSSNISRQVHCNHIYTYPSYYMYITVYPIVHILHTYLGIDVYDMYVYLLIRLPVPRHEPQPTVSLPTHVLH